MPVRLEYRDEGRGVVFVCTGTVTGADLIAANDALYSDRRLSRLEYQLVDLSGAREITVTPEDVRRLAEQDSDAARRRSDLAVVVVSGDELTYGMTRMWAGHVEVSGAPITPHVVRNLAEAEAWVLALRSSRRTGS